MYCSGAWWGGIAGAPRRPPGLSSDWKRSWSTLLVVAVVRYQFHWKYKEKGINYYTIYILKYFITLTFPFWCPSEVVGSTRRHETNKSIKNTRESRIKNQERAPLSRSEEERTTCCHVVTQSSGVFGEPRTEPQHNRLSSFHASFKCHPSISVAVQT